MSERCDGGRRATLRAVWDTVVPRVERPRDPHGVWTRGATDLAVEAATDQAPLAMAKLRLARTLELIDALGQQGSDHQSRLARERTQRNVAPLGGAQAAAGVGRLISLTSFVADGMPDPATGQDSDWAAFRCRGRADEAAALRVARRLRTGHVEIDGAAHDPLPSGGVEQSGHGREYGPWGMAEFTTVEAKQR